MSKNLTKRWLAACAAGAVLVAAGCTTQNEYQPPPPPPVTIAQPVVQSVTDYIEENGTTEAIDFVEIRARVKGFLQAINFQPNQQVKKDALLYKIDAREYEAQVNQHKAAVTVAKARYLEADARLKRGEQAYKGGAITAEEFGERKAMRDVARAEILAEEAALNESVLQLSFTDVTSPIEGMVGKTLVYEGNLVGNVDATHLTTVVRYNPIYATFNISERALLDVMETRGPRDVETDRSDVRLYLARANDEGFPFEGRLEYTDLAVDESTGTNSIRGVFPNPELKILPGLYVRIRVPIGTREAALLVPGRALGADQRGKFLLIVTDEGRVERRNVEAGADVGEMVVIEKGIRGEDWVIVDGLQRARPGEAVTATKSQLSTPAPAEEKPAGQPQPAAKPKPAQPAAGAAEKPPAAPAN